MVQSLLINVAIISVTLLFGLSGLQTFEIEKEWTNDSSGLQSTQSSTTEPPIVCGNTTCHFGEICVYAAILCAEEGECIPPPPQCVRIVDEYHIATVKPVDPCANTTCAEGYECIKNQEDPTKAKCQFIVPCSKLKCERGYECETFPKKCPLIGPCKVYGECVRVDPCKFSNCYEGQVCVPSEHDPTQAECKRRDPCSLVKCKTRYTCESVAPPCSRLFPCPEPQSECIPINPCLNFTCTGGRFCTQTKNDPTVAKCVRNPCDDFVCPTGKTCEAVIEYCKTPPCLQPRAQCLKNVKYLCGSVYCDPGYVCKNISVSRCKKPKCKVYKKTCVPIDPCANTTCAEGYECVKNPEDPTKAKCQFIVPCSKLKCERGYECETFPKKCPLIGPCKVYGECVRVDPCKFSNCYEGQFCVPSEHDPTQAECKRRDPCSLVKCNSGYICEIITPSCPGLFPCPEPYSKCVPNNPCSNYTCTEGRHCTQAVNDPTVAECVKNPCDDFECPFGKKCETVVEYCKTPPCLRPRTQCTKSVEFLCGSVYCDPGYVCKNISVSSCEEPKCKENIKTCVPIDPCANTTCAEGYECVKSTEDPTKAKCQFIVPCSKLKCERGYECETFPKKCPLIGPCKVYGECVRVDPCKFSNCYEGQVCVPSEHDPTQAECKRLPA